MIGHLFGVAPASGAKQKPAIRNLIARGDELCRLNRIAMNHETHAGADAQRTVVAAAAVSETEGSITSL